MIKLSLIVCTYNREFILSDCLDSLVEQTADKSLYEVIVINNNSTDNTQKIAEEYARNHENFRVVKESQQGLSVARNRGYKEAKYDWVSYIDDDAKAFPNYVERAIETIEKYNFDCFGGIYYPWYRDRSRPKWLPESYGQSVKHKETVAILDNGSITGNVCVFRKEPLEAIGGFPEDLGMNGDRIAYGEETYVQLRLQEKGYSIGYDPEFCIMHLVHPDKLTISWQIRSEFAAGRDSVRIFNRSEPVGFFKFIDQSIRLFIKNSFKASKKLLSEKDYYLQNGILEVTKPLARYYGFFKANKKT